MIRDALKYLVELGENKIHELHNQKYSVKQLHHVSEPKVQPIYINNLTGLVDYIKSGFDKDYFRGTLVHIESHECVKLVSNILSDAGRETYVVANAFKPKFNYDRYYSAEDFNIALQSCFVRNEDIEKILKLVGNITEETVNQFNDDGVTQTVAARTGIVKVENVDVPNPVVLAPYRTFAEVTQPASKFVLRMKQGAQCALFEADGGAWKLDAMDIIKEYLKKELSDIDIKIIS